MRQIGKILLLFALFLVVTTQRVEAHGGGIECLRNLAAAMDPTATFNTFMAQKYPKLKFMLQDPDAFIAKMRQRFQDYKKLHPDSPHMFDYSELGMPLAQDLNKVLIDKIAEMTAYTGKKLRTTNEEFIFSTLRISKKSHRRLLIVAQWGTVRLSNSITFIQGRLGISTRVNFVG